MEEGLLSRQGLAVVMLWAMLVWPACDDEQIPADSAVTADAQRIDSHAADQRAPDRGADLRLDLAADSPRPDQALPDAGGGLCNKIVVASKQDLLKVIQQLVWTGYSPTSAGFVPLSRPLQISGTITVTAKDLKPPTGCTPANVCYQTVLFAAGLSAGKLPAGVALSGKSSAVPLTAHDTLTISKATVRLRAVVENIHPFTYNFTPLIRLEPDCGGACPNATQTCSKDQLCYSSDRFCRLCLALPHTQCACRKFTTTVADGTACSYLAKTMSALCHGTCKSGLCVYQGTPSVYCP